MSSYQVAWLVYGMCAAGVLWVLARVLQCRFVQPLRTPGLLVAAALLLTPVHMPEQAGWYAPAVIGSAIGLLDDGPDAMMAMLETPLAIGLLLVLFWVLWRMGVWAYGRWRNKQNTMNEQPEKEASHEI